MYATLNKIVRIIPACTFAPLCNLAYKFNVPIIKSDISVCLHGCVPWAGEQAAGL